MDASAYLLGREAGKLEPPYAGHDQIFAAQRLDGNSIKNAKYEHCTFANISFKGSTLEESAFLNCVFIGCYFRSTTLKDCGFTACKFIDCEFPKVSCRGCIFRYAKFSGCIVSFDEIRLNLPQEPNLREELCRNLAIEASLLGFRQDVRAFRMHEIESREEHLLAAAKAESSWYQEHYKSMRRIWGGFLLVFQRLKSRSLGLRREG